MNPVEATSSRVSPASGLGQVEGRVRRGTGADEVADPGGVTRLDRVNGKRPRPGPAGDWIQRRLSLVRGRAPDPRRRQRCVRTGSLLLGRPAEVEERLLGRLASRHVEQRLHVRPLDRPDPRAPPCAPRRGSARAAARPPCRSRPGGTRAQGRNSGSPRRSCFAPAGSSGRTNAPGAAPTPATSALPRNPRRESQGVDVPGRGSGGRRPPGARRRGRALQW